MTLAICYLPNMMPKEKWRRPACSLHQKSFWLVLGGVGLETLTKKTGFYFPIQFCFPFSGCATLVHGFIMVFPRGYTRHRMSVAILALVLLVQAWKAPCRRVGTRGSHWLEMCWVSLDEVLVKDFPLTVGLGNWCFQ